MTSTGTDASLARAREARDEPGLFVAGGVLFAASAAVTVAWCGPMQGGMPMPGGWTMPMAWMRMSGQSWPAAAAVFLGMWLVMMVAMMTPSLVPMLRHDRAAARARGEDGLATRGAVVMAGYFAVWTLFGLLAYPPGTALAAAQMRWAPVSRAAPLAAGLALVAAGALQFAPWKRRHLELCRDAACAAPAASAWRAGLVLGARCVRCCLGPMLALLVLGVMDLGVMALVAAAITAERLLPRPVAVARATGLLGIAAGAWILLCKPS